MAAPKTSLTRGRAAFDLRAWADAFDALAAADRDTPLERADLERLAWAAALRGQDEAFLGGLERVHKLCVETDDHRAAARAAFWIGFHLASLGSASAEGWLARARRLIEHEPATCAERGYLLLPSVYQQLEAGENVQAAATAHEAARIGDRCGDHDLIALARILEGRALVRQGRVEAGLGLLDEVMLSVTAGELSPLVTGIVYCNGIVSCQQLYAVERAREWTEALSRWCEEQPQLVTFTGLCSVHRAEILQIGGAWTEAMEQVRGICERYSRADPEVFGDACYEQGELFRLRGDFTEAEAAYRLASDNGRDPQPGLALMRLEQGQIAPSINAIRRALGTTTVKWQRARLLPAFVEITLAAGEIDEARTACDELDALARELGTSILGAIAAHARGALAVAQGDYQAAVEPLRHAFGTWQKAGAPYIAARIRVELARALRGLGDSEGAELEQDAARSVFQELGAVPALASLDPRDSTLHGLSKRELEVLRLLARGETNKGIARALFLSERTVERHVSNIFSKIGVRTRAAATAFAHQNQLI